MEERCQRQRLFLGGTVISNDNAGQWAIVELMGHKVVAGLASEVTMYGQPMLRVDVPATEAFPPFTQIYGGSSIYCMTPVSEEVAKMAANRAQVNPISVYMPELVTREKMQEVIRQYEERLERARQLPSSTEDRED